ncbi:1-deoxy-D-xylulose-5-phosphate reductoisomerase [Trichlorobacter ammonificans]|uniref:1-deoxy-D-xylulose 5-phosphate reductoisomerase n=1 Tax=Trichlorobacter ammonificans TaxID=2916410 RepID=A0ABN8HH70_9BACT|nr:1-deoxy-D-xylulose-5-phosphate reductoisomerase [Trichlorobacter ammonificans]CAH2030824.1 1-deoxy-D-xylulose 5-phosphate reductoisomerase [Trichlorobacter ammonificans]
MKQIAILGSTGSIGVSTLDIVAAHPDKFRVTAMTAGRNLELFADQIRQFRPDIAAVADEKDIPRLRELLAGHPVTFTGGIDGLCAAATAPGVEMVVAAIVGAAGLVPTAAAIRAGKDIALANKEILVTAGHLFMELVARHKVRLYPVDSEHSAVFQSIEGHRSDDIVRIILTASGGPFRETPLEKLEQVTIQDALNHPNWSMGRKITIDSATMMNKGLEVIEARWLFDVPPEKIAVNIHPQSIIHSMVEYIDGCVIAQLGTPDMKAPIAYALSYPERVSTGVPPLDLTELAGLTFFKPDLLRFPCLGLAYRALAEGESMPAVMNAANEVAVEAFLSGRISYLQIARLIERTMDAHRAHRLTSIEEVLAADQWGRRTAADLCGTCATMEASS